MRTQADFFKAESWKFFQRNYLGKNLRERELNPYLESIFQAYPIRIHGGAILEVGCGPASNLYRLCRQLKAQRGVGTEPSREVVALLRQTFPELEFVASDSLTLPFDSATFDLVIVRSVLHWVDRDFILQTIGEILRVSRRYVVISDFAPAAKRSAVYHHAPTFRTYKLSYVGLIEAAGTARCVASLCSNPQDEWNAVQTAIFEKVPTEQAFPLIDPPPGGGR
jgi:ubiquinone/menaquinone biosynthesis C-methylase UbiE